MRLVGFILSERIHIDHGHSADRRSGNLVVIREMGFDGIEQALKLINDEGWGYTHAEIALMVRQDPHGSFLCWDGDRLAGVLTCVTFGKTGVVGHLVVAKYARGKRLGQALIKRAIDYCEGKGCESIILYATEVGQKLYERAGFEVKREAFCYHSRLKEKDMGAKENPCEPLRREDLGEVARIDSETFGDDRSKLFPMQFDEFPNHAFKLMRSGRMAGYVMGRTTTDGFDIASLNCWTGDEDAELLFRAVLRSFGPGHVYMCGFTDNKGAARMNESLDLIKFWRVKFMVRGKDRYPTGVRSVFSVMSFEFG